MNPCNGHCIVVPVPAVRHGNSRAIIPGVYCKPRQAIDSFPFYRFLIHQAVFNRIFDENAQWHGTLLA